MPTLAASAAEQHLGDQADYLLGFNNPKIPRNRLHLPGPDLLDRTLLNSNRSNRVLVSLHRIIGHGRLAETGYISILPVDQGVEHSAGASFACNPDYFDPERIVELAIEGGCNAVASTFGVLGAVSRKFAHKIPFVVKINHNELLSYPNRYDQMMFGTIRQALEMRRSRGDDLLRIRRKHPAVSEVSEAIALAHEQGMATILWCYLRSPAFKEGNRDYHSSADLTGQANHLGVTVQADIVKQKLAENNGGYKALNRDTKAFGKFD
jgi:fructose-bisphosphate aldolase, class I